MFALGNDRSFDMGNGDDSIADIEELMKEEQRKEHPDYRITVYCDHHLGVKMRLATQWRSIEYNENFGGHQPYPCLVLSQTRLYPLLRTHDVWLPLG